MSRVAKVAAKAAIAFAGLGLTFIYGPAGVAVSFVGYFLTTFAVTELNVPSARFIQGLSVLANAAAIQVATGSPLLAGVVVPVGLLGLPNEFVLSRWRSLHDFQPLIGLLLSLLALGLAWPVGVWGFAVVPNLLVGLLLTFFGLSGRSAAGKALQQAKVQVGQPMPDLKLPTRDGAGQFDLAQARGSFVLLVFVRGDWCPVCHVMMRVINKERDTLAKHGVKLLIVTPSEGAVDEEFGRELGLDASMLLDVRAEAAKSMGLLDAQKRDGGDVPLPVALLVDRQGTLRNITRPDDVTNYASEQKISRALAQYETAS